ncbi:MAG TPA: DUF2520 domain-containing protein, partial [Gammaproteobacteria bacterium]|nr:DUF2520 domain-containing protein [Gammaproteobacteria bacterium]
MTRASINIIGCGKLGKTLANLFNKQKNLLLSGIVNSSYESAVKAVQFIGGGQAYAQLRDLPAADFFFITTPDDKIQAVCEELVSGNQLQPGTIVVHCSGSLSSEVLSKARQKGGHIASLHPVKSFAQPQECVTSFSGTYCALEGDAAALPRLKNLFGSLGAKIFLIKQEKKALYHAASVLANNYLISLHHQALQAYHFADLDEQTANHLTTMLMTDALQNLKKLPHSAALTGPLQRGDKQTLEKHLQALAPHSELSSVYTTLGRSTLPLTQHSETQKKSLALLFKASPSKVLTASWLDTPLGPMIALADEEALCALNFADQEDLERELARLRTKTQACLVPGET